MNSSGDRPAGRGRGRGRPKNQTPPPSPTAVSKQPEPVVDNPEFEEQDIDETDLACNSCNCIMKYMEDPAITGETRIESRFYPKNSEYLQYVQQNSTNLIKKF